jgi:hypothetical protein
MIKSSGAHFRFGVMRVGTPSYHSCSRYRVHIFSGPISFGLFYICFLYSVWIPDSFFNSFWSTDSSTGRSSVLGRFEMDSSLTQWMKYQRLDNRGSSPGRGRNFLFAIMSRLGLWSTQPLSNDSRVSFPRNKLGGAWSLPLTSIWYRG